MQFYNTKHLHISKIIASAMLALSLFTIIHLSVSADDQFDVSYYAQRYPDVVEVFGTDETALRNHYQTYGIREGRFQNQQEENSGIPAKAPEVLYPTYVDIDLESQIVTYYEDSKPVLVSACVTGNTSAGHGTPAGTYEILTKTPGKRLKGPTWDVWVDRWMMFTNSHIGLHDANWRSRFGGEIYKTNGSHGCVNLPHDVAEALYDKVSVGTVVVVH